MSERNIAPEPIILRISGGYRRLSTPSVYAFAPTVPEPEPILADDGFDRNCWTSVFEHVRVPSAVVAEAAHVLKLRGLFHFTIDLDMSGLYDIGLHEHARLCDALLSRFDYLYPERTIHPADCLLGDFRHSSATSPGNCHYWWFVFKQHVIKPVLGEKVAQTNFLAILAFALTKTDHG